MAQSIRHPEPLLYQTAVAEPVQIAGPEHLITGLSWMLALLFLWGQMAFPVIPTGGRVVTGVQTGNSGTRTFPSLTGLTKDSGDLLLAIIVAYQSSSGAGAPGGTVFSAWGASFTEFCDQMTTNSSTMAIGAAYKWSDGTETGTFTVTQAATVTGEAAFVLLSIQGPHPTTVPETGTIADGTAAAADPGSLNPSGWTTEDTLWIAVAACGETATTGSFTGVASAPANYTGYAETGISADVVGGVEGAVAFRQLAAASEDPGTFSVDVSNARNSALLLAVRPLFLPRDMYYYDQAVNRGSVYQMYIPTTQLTQGVSSPDMRGGLCWPLAMDLGQAVIQAAGGAFGSNTLMRGTRTIIPVSGTLTSIAVYVAASAGNFAGAVLDTSATTRNVLYNSGAIAVPGTGWQVIGNPNLAVTQGEQLDFVVGFSSASNTVAFFDDSSTAASFTVPTGYLIAPLGGQNLIVWNDTVTPGSYGATVAESELSTISAAPLIIGQVA